MTRPLVTFSFIRTAQITTETSPRLVVWQNGDPIITRSRGIQHAFRQVEGALSPAATSGLEELAQYLKTHQRLQVEITGWRDASELGNRKFRKGGLMRANHLAHILMRMGVSANQLVLSDRVHRVSYMQSGTMDQGVSFQILNALPDPSQSMEIYTVQEYPGSGKPAGNRDWK
ncbi:hypothetical protein [Pontibacter sp. G13]|uniref:hypothetical protein n=1 Tax=Pontibacter sp. G13 TaxID=3074898 RepID=UPI00288B0892|nr:hypothetical protein [Pontibacter sp. G13]WNJ16768.1 hypothetical protein RJD25_18020 [Pontibacter sp. G13]